MSRLLDYIHDHEGDPGEDAGPVDFDKLLESVNDIDWDGVNQYMERLLREEDASRGK